MGSVDNKEIKKLCMKNGRYCVICRCDLIIKDESTDRETIIAEMAHIRGNKPGAARYDVSMTQKERDSADNIILLCPTCHKKVDDQPGVYTVEKLTQTKTEYEKWISERTRSAIVNITFAELEVVTKYLVSSKAVASDSFVLVPPKDKIRKNNLSAKIESLIRIGMIQVKQVADYIEKSPDAEFGDRIREGFVLEYEKLRNQDKIDGDELFNELLNFASGGTTDFAKRAAGLAVLVYLFEKCEVFEK